MPIAAIERIPVPTLALIHGQCYAGALEVCLACDLIWAAEGSQIGQIEAVAGGITYGGGTQRIASRIGAARAEGPTVMLSHDLQEGLLSPQRDGPGHAKFTNR